MSVQPESVLTNVRAPRVARARRLLKRGFRHDDHAFLAEGPQAAREAAHTGRVRELFITVDAAKRYPEIVTAVTESGGTVTECTGEIIEALSSTVTPQGMVAVTAQADVSLDEAIPAGATLIATLAHVRDPGNAGSVIRVADAAGANGVVVTTESVDVHNSKVVRSSAGSLFHLPVAEEQPLADVIARAKSLGLQVLAADGSGQPFDQGVDLSLPTMWVFGNEAWGIPDEILAQVDTVVSIPIYGQAESLNLATAAAVCLYASAQAQRAGK